MLTKKMREAIAVVIVGLVLVLLGAIGKDTVAGGLVLTLGAVMLLAGGITVAVRLVREGDKAPQ